jgi:hypothetical protein
MGKEFNSRQGVQHGGLTQWKSLFKNLKARTKNQQQPT